MRPLVAALALVALSSASGCIAAPAGRPLATSPEIFDDVEKVKKVHDQPARSNLADRMLSDLTGNYEAGKMDGLDDKLIDALIPLLEDDDDVVRGYAAGGLGMFGPRAARAIAPLERALKRIDDEMDKNPLPFSEGHNSVPYIVLALKRVRGLPDTEDRGP